MKQKKKKPAVRGYIEFREKGTIQDLKGKKVKLKPIKKEKLN